MAAAGIKDLPGINSADRIDSCGELATIRTRPHHPRVLNQSARLLVNVFSLMGCLDNPDMNTYPDELDLKRQITTTLIGATLKIQ